MSKFISKTLEDTTEFAKSFVEKLGANEEKATVLLLVGDLGSGKTTFTQALARALRVKDNLTSPTFVLMKSYEIPKKGISPCEASAKQGRLKRLVHIDAYRLNSSHDLEALGWAELVANPENLIVVEWPERVEGIFNGTEQKLYFKFIDEKTREIEYSLD